MSTWTDQEVNAAVQAITQRSATDMEFRQQLLADPSEAIQEQTGKDLPDGFVVRFIENNGADLTLVLPDPIAVGGELSDAELEQVAGGSKCLVGTCGGSAVCAVDTNTCLVTCGGSSVL